MIRGCMYMHPLFLCPNSEFCEAYFIKNTAVTLALTSI